MLQSTRSRLIVSFLGVSLVAGAVSLLVGGLQLYRAVLQEASSRVRLDLNAAREIYLNQLRQMTVALHITALSPGLRAALARGDTGDLVPRLRLLAEHAGLDFAGLATSDGRTLCRSGPVPVPTGPEPSRNPVVAAALERGVEVAGTVVLSPECLAVEDPGLAAQARIALLPTPMATPQPKGEETSGMTQGAAVPVLEGGRLLGVLYGGILLNRSHAIVDRVRETVFQQETHGGRSIGTATVFLGDVRISTNVPASEGVRAIGTRVSREVHDRVLVEGGKWTGRAFVVSDWYITAYEPIEDIHGRRVGILYVGVLEAKYADMGRRALSLFILITLGGMVLAIGLGYILADRIMRPVQSLISASQAVSQGNLAPPIGPISTGEVGVLQHTFGEMLSSLAEREQRQRAENEVRLLHSEKEASIGRLAAGVAHEINNPLTGVLTFTHMLLRRKDLSDEVRADLETVAQETDRVRRIVRGLLDFSRQGRLRLEPTDVNGLVRTTLALVENQALIKGIRLELRAGEGLPA
ncbi:MAG: cache domain-containing protein, partial [Candidatus Latescibacterota bacterium]